MVQQLTVIHREQNINLTDKQIADRATIQSFLNCYLKETGSGRVDSRQEYPELQTRLESLQILCCYLPHQGVEVKAGLRYFSLTGRHCFEFPLYYQMAGKSELLDLDYVTLVALFSKELALANHSSGSQDELLLRVVQSCHNIEQFVRDRRRD
ncbi:hypothetical protein J0895_18985, partial [Phormidium pseudopriestleyi FRX01]|nr:hypothetical protein [Phormidium pseudopriestleyi FRX01]